MTTVLARLRGHVVATVSLAVFAQFAGATAVLPMLPLFLRREHTSVGLIGVVMSAFFAAGVLTQYLAGHISDRVGHRRVMLAGFVIYSVASIGFLAHVGPGGYVALRAAQGLGSGALQLAGLALVGLVVPLQERGRAFARVFAAQLSGMAIGPLLGSIAGVSHIRWLFVAAAVLSLLAAAPVLAIGPIHQPPASAVSARHIGRSPAFIGVLCVAGAAGIGAGVYEACWTLLMTSRGAHTWQIGLSWSMFAGSFALFSPIAGRWNDRYDRRWLAFFAMLSTTCFLAAYPFLAQLPLLIGLGAIEAIGVAIALPAAQSLLSQLAPADALGRAQGLFTTVENGAMAVAAASAGYLFASARWLPFVGAAVISLALTAALPLLWRRVIGRAQLASSVGAVSSARHEAVAVVEVTAKA